LSNEALGKEQPVQGIAEPGLAWVVEVLRRQAMPAEEIGAVLTADDRLTVHRYLELHRERLQERLTEEHNAVARIERLLTDARTAPAGVGVRISAR
jgi:hypothetical protein